MEHIGGVGHCQNFTTQGIIIEWRLRERIISQGNV